ncbi:unnamed protein product, partial [Discosporangium mesarthrocarpum]
ESIPFFAKYRRWKRFAVWRRLVKAFKFNQAARSLASKLFLFNPQLRRAILAIQGDCVGVAGQQLLGLSSGVTITLQAFLDGQEQTRQATAKVCIGVSLMFCCCRCCC